MLLAVDPWASRKSATALVIISRRDGVEGAWDSLNDRLRSLELEAALGLEADENMLSVVVRRYRRKTLHRKSIRKL